MGLLDIIPGVSTGKTIVAAGTGFAVGSVGMHLIGQHGKKKIEKKAEKEKEKLIKQYESKLKEHDDYILEKEKSAIARVAILKILAWKDNILHDKEKIFLVDYIVKCVDIRDSHKIQAIKEIEIAPPKIDRLYEYIPFLAQNKIELCSSAEEIEGFKCILNIFAMLDKEIHTDEQKYISKVISQIESLL